ncbi:MAG TPA: VOC family protein [Chloroflexota bacterium]|jgi:predicted enzyme related to lactoylglutathione lyase
MVRAEGIQSVNWNAPDPAAAERFYTEVLGGKVTTRHQVRGVDVVRVRVGATGIGLFDASHGPASGVPHHTFRMTWEPNEAEAAAALESRGARVVNSRPHGDGPGYSLYVTDPVGNYLELSFDPPA